MPRTRSTKPANSPTEDDTSNIDTSTPKALSPSVSTPPKVFVLPKNTSPDARIATLSHPVNSTPSRYLIDPDLGFHEFTRITAPKSTPRSWLLVSDPPSPDSLDTTTPSPEPLNPAFITQNPDLFIATPLDALFLVLPALAPKSSRQAEKQLFLSFDDHLDTLYASSPHLRTLVSRHEPLKTRLERRMAACSDTVSAGPETMYRLSLPKLLSLLVKKAERMCSSPFPSSLETRFIKPALEVPVLSIKREESSVSIVAETSSTQVSSSETTTTATQSTVTESQTTTMDSQSTTLTTPDDDNLQSLSTPPTIPPLLRLQTCLNYLLSSYIPTSLHTPLRSLLSSPPPSVSVPNFEPLTTHLAAIAKLKSEALILRSISDNISRKRGFEDDEEKIAEREEKKRKREEEEKKKKTETRGVKQLRKVDTSGMKKLSSFFTRAAKKA
ncbi:hypothetical protein M011DRAFT_427173 [Sporormia fimetaria CBS 119925]|uniref:Ribonuclease H2 subunit B n=1 Tax=Sporormia fimetaria CBS 119925 TaxID=1340428 RepID=A0A6A6V4J0_9PLEO|nr:hypothetical protein M011DRAFT_427173 [Sporormia fimetaria CBS 119925]